VEQNRGDIVIKIAILMHRTVIKANYFMLWFFSLMLLILS